MTDPVLSPEEKASLVRRKWWAIALATGAGTFSYGGILFGLVAAMSEDAQAWEGALILGMASVPFLFVILAFVSKHPSAPSAVLKAMGLFLLAGVAFSIGVNPFVGVVAGFGVGGAVALRPAAPTMRRRLWGVAMALGVLMALLLTVPPIAVAVAPFLPFVAVGFADHGGGSSAKEIS